MENLLSNKILVTYTLVLTNTKAWFPPGDTFLEIEIETIVTFIPRR